MCNVWKARFFPSSDPRLACRSVVTKIRPTKSLQFTDELSGIQNWGGRTLFDSWNGVYDFLLFPRSDTLRLFLAFGRWFGCLLVSLVVIESIDSNISLFIWRSSFHFTLFHLTCLSSTIYDTIRSKKRFDDPKINTKLRTNKKDETRHKKSNENEHKFCYTLMVNHDQVFIRFFFLPISLSLSLSLYIFCICRMTHDTRHEQFRGMNQIDFWTKLTAHSDSNVNG